MNILSKSGIIFLTVLMLTMPILIACGDDNETDEKASDVAPTSTVVATHESPESSETPIATPVTSPTSELTTSTWTCDISYKDETTTATVIVIGLQTIHDTECYLTEMTYDNPLSRLTPTGTPLRFFDAKSWIDTTRLNERKLETSVEAMGSISVKHMISRDYPETSHGLPLSVGMVWSFDELIHLEPPLQPDAMSTWEAEVVIIEDVTIPMGTYPCYRVEYSRVATDGTEIETRKVDKTEWWATGNGFLVPVKVENYTAYDQTESRELASFSTLSEPIPTIASTTTPEPTPDEKPTESLVIEALSNTERLMTGQAWEEFCDSIKAVGEVILREDVPGSDLDRAEGFRHLSRMVTAAFEVMIEDADPDFPYFIRQPDLETQSGFDAPDQIYLHAPIRGDAEYRITGNRGTVHRLVFQVGAGWDVFGDSRRISYLTSEELETDGDGNFEIILSAKPHEGNWMALESDANDVMVRQVFYDWDNEVPAELHINQIGKEGKSPDALDAARMAQMLDSAAAFMIANVEHWTEMQLNLVAALPENTLSPPRIVAGQGAQDQYYGGGPFNLAEDEAMIIEIAPTDAVYWCIQLANFWWESLDYVNRQVSLNGHQAHLGSDGIYRFVVSNEDPGVPNWLDTADHSTGMLLARFQGPSDVPTPPVTKVVKFGNVWDEFPEDTPYIDSDQREDDITRRQAHIAQRYNQ